MISTRMQCMLDQGQAMADIFTAEDKLAKRSPFYKCLIPYLLFIRLNGKKAKAIRKC